MAPESQRCDKCQLCHDEKQIKNRGIVEMLFV